MVEGRPASIPLQVGRTSTPPNGSAKYLVDPPLKVKKAASSASNDYNETTIASNDYWTSLESLTSIGTPAQSFQTRYDLSIGFSSISDCSNYFTSTDSTSLIDLETDSITFDPFWASSI